MGFREVWGIEPIQNLMNHEKSGLNSQILGIAVDDHYGFYDNLSMIYIKYILSLACHNFQFTHSHILIYHPFMYHIHPN